MPNYIFAEFLMTNLAVALRRLGHIDEDGICQADGEPWEDCPTINAVKEAITAAQNGIRFEKHDVGS